MMPEFIVSYIYVDETDEERCISRFLWEAKDKKESRERAEAIARQILMDAEEGYDCTLDIENLHITQETTAGFLADYSMRGQEKLELYENVKKYAFVQEGATVIWNDPDDGACSGPKIVKSCTYYYDEDSTVLLANEDGSGETEAYYSEIDPYKETP